MTALQCSSFVQSNHNRTKAEQRHLPTSVTPYSEIAKTKNHRFPKLHKGTILFSGESSGKQNPSGSRGSLENTELNLQLPKKFRLAHHKTPQFPHSHSFYLKFILGLFIKINNSVCIQPSYIPGVHLADCTEQSLAITVSSV